MLSQMKILSLCHYLQGPGAVQYLADMGADVIKLEPVGGAFERAWSGADVYVGDVSAFYLCANKNKRSLALNLKAPEGRELFFKLLERIDVLVENFRPGVMDRLGLGYEALKARKPGLIYASATGFGGTGPMAEKPGQDLLLQARTGLMAVTGHPSRPTAVGCAAVDQHGAALLAMGILGAYAKRLTTGEGTRVEGSLFNAGIDLQAEALTGFLSGNFTAAKLQRDEHLATWFHQSPYGVYEALDGFVAISNIDPVKLAQALESDALMDMAHLNRFEDRDDYAREVAAQVARRTIAQISEAFDALSLWYAPVQDYNDLLRDPQALHNEVFRMIEIDGSPATLVNHPIRYDGKAPALHTLALTPGEHSAQILEEIGCTADQIRQLAAQGVVRTADAPAHGKKHWRAVQRPAATA
ncbi:CaiB/BaiF CoA transferase family protein [Castellaniella sp. S9]|uniref:CaiB/BaiF CoA transferase family protein n=1 Tax=Castellaniella sp. S9 TaxID=2993652 RepID=UPI0022B3A201|nr:CaiB/BaiF CoA-transferase family protein [Castellaniella sp. S9]